MEFSAQGIPIIDFAPIAASERHHSQAEVASQVATAMENFSCFYIKNHGIPLSLLQESRRDIQRFFASSEGYKTQFCIDGRIRGYVPFEEVNVNKFLGRHGFAGDPVERFVIGPVQEGGSSAHKNRWPDQPGTFRRNLENLYSGLYCLTDKLITVLTTAACVSDFEEFSKVCRSGDNLMKVNFYPGNLTPKTNQSDRLAEHTDASAFTILVNDGRGLQAKIANGEWLDADHVPGTLFVLLGETLARYLNHKWQPLVHRVALPEEDENIDRISLVYFVSQYRFLERGPY